MYQILLTIFFIIIVIFIIQMITFAKYQTIETYVNSEINESVINELDNNQSNNETEKQMISRIFREADEEEENAENEVEPVYEPDNYNVEYHESAEDLEESYGYGLGYKTIFVYDSAGSRDITGQNDNQNYIAVEVAENQTYPLYNEPNYFRYGNQSYVPSYSDQIALSSRTNPSNQQSTNTPTTTNFLGYRYEQPMATFTR
jgi:hypothetical protein